ncbi:hypothetical protein BJ170DRAFT_683328 [Xylariales sp. AK1849]|nr:hypothetical protein BJ170DRAFT_683328 [Xylariales sp. AK1849]
MQHQSPRPKNSGRRRPGRNGTPQKVYASENDAVYRQQQHHSDSPATPQKTIPGGPATVEHAQSTSQRQRNRNSTSKKPRNKQDRQSPSLTTFSDQSQPTLAAFAGASFHASPAPSALPLPSFLARTTSAPDSPDSKPPMSIPTQELSPPTTDSEENSSPSPPVVERNEESPLEFFFKAHRAEKAKSARRASSANVIPLGPFSPPHDSPLEVNTIPKMNSSVPPRHPSLQRHLSSGIPSSELDGTPGRPMGQAFSTPFAERIRAARSHNNSAPVTPSATKNDDLDRSEALKRYLFSGMKVNQPQPAPQQAPSPQAAQHKLPRGMFPASVLNGGSPTQQRPSKPRPAAPMDPQAERVRRMEDSLRSVLKLNPS